MGIFLNELSSAFEFAGDNDLTPNEFLLKMEEIESWVMENYSPEIQDNFDYNDASLLFLGLAVHASNFIKTNPISALMVIIGAPAVGFSFFILKNGMLIILSCLLFAMGLVLLLYRKEKQKIVTE